MSDLEIIPIDPLDQAGVDQWLALLQAAQDNDAPHLPEVVPAPAIVGLVRQRSVNRYEQLLARRDGQVVGAAHVTFPLKDNLHMAEVELTVAPDLRRQGIGTALRDHVEQRVAADSRNTIIGYVVDPIDGGPARPVDGQRFAEAAGYAKGLDEIHRVADLSVAPDDAGLLAEAWRRADGYELVQWVGRLPEDIEDGIAYLTGRMNIDAPIGELAIEQENVDAARIRERQAQVRAQGMVELGTAVRHRATGTVAGYSDILLVPGDELHCYQGNTIVDPEHRGRRLGTIVKIENHRQLVSYRPRMRYVHTWNAEVNAHMIGINEAIGYRAVDRWIAYQKKLAG